MACAGNELNLFLSQLWLGFIIESGRQTMYSKLFIIRPGCSRFLEFEKNIVLFVGKRPFPNIQTRLFNRAQNWQWQA